MSKINLNKQSDLSLTSANITSPIGIEKTDLPGLVGDLEGLSATDNEINAALAAETTRALQAEKVVTQAISDEADAARAAELGLSNQIADIISNVDPAALDSLTEVVGAFQAADGDLSAAITAALGTHTSELAKEIADRISGDAATLAYAKAYTDALEAVHVADEAAAAAAIVAAKAASDGEIADAAFAADAARVAAKVVADGQVKAISDTVNANQVESEEADTTLTTNLSLEMKRAMDAELELTNKIDDEIDRALSAESGLDVRVSALISNEDLASNDSFTEALAEVNRVSSLNIEEIYSKAIGSTFNSELGTIVLDGEVKPGSHMFYMNGLLMAAKSDFIATESLSGYVTGATLIGDSLTLANAGGVIATYGVYGETTEAEFANFAEGEDTIIRKGE